MRDTGPDGVKASTRGTTQPGLVGSASQTLLTRIAAFGLFLVANVILARSLGPSGRGAYAVAVLIPTIASLIAQLGVGPANFYYVSKQLIARGEVVAHSLSLASLLGIASFLVLAGLIAATDRRRFMGVDSTYILVASSAIPFLLLTGYMLGILNGDQRYRLFNSVVLINYGTLLLALAIALLIFSQRTLGAVIAWTVSTDVTGVVAALFVSPIGSWRLRLARPTLRLLLGFGLLSYLGSLTSAVNYRFDVLIVNAFAGARQVGLYSVGTGLAEVIWYLPNAAQVVLAPRVAMADQEDADRMTETVNRVVVVLVLVAAGLLAATAPFLILLFFGGDYAQSVWAVWLLLPGTITFSTSKVLSSYLLGRNKLKVDLASALTALVVTLSLDLLLIPRYGFIGAAIASSVAYTCAMGVNLRWLVRHTSISVRGLFVPRSADLKQLLLRARETGVAVIQGLGRHKPVDRETDRR